MSFANPRVLILQHTDLTTPGSAAGLLAAAGVPFFVRHLHRGHALPEAHEYDSVLVCGGGVHVDEEAKAPYLIDEKSFLRRAVDRGTPTLGLCLGAQLLAQALGARVGPHPRGWEVGWHDVDCLSTPGVGGFETPTVLRVSHYHRYVFDLPAHARVVARNAWWDVQGFAYADHVLALQFHPERTLNSNRELALEDDLPPLDAGQTQSRSEILSDAHACERAVRPWFRRVLLSALAPGKTVADSE